MIDKIKKYRWLIILVTFFLAIGIPFIIHCVYKIKINNSFFVAEWSAGELLLYYGSLLSFLATVVLSCLALWQNHIIKEESDKHTEQLEEMEKIKNSPLFSLKARGYTGNYENLELELVNISENVAIQPALSNVQMFDCKSREKIWSAPGVYQYDVIWPREGQKIQLKNKEIYL